MTSPGAGPMRRFAIILGGGRSARMGRDKRELVLDGRSLLGHAVDACRDREVTVVVSPGLPADVDAAAVRLTVEEPAFGGPVAGLAAGLAALPAIESTDEVLVLACDLPRPAAAVAVLDAATSGPDGVLLTDADGRPQYLTARYLRQPLTHALADLGELNGASMRRLVSGLTLAHVDAPEVTADIDTPADARAAGID